MKRFKPNAEEKYYTFEKAICEFCRDEFLFSQYTKRKPHFCSNACKQKAYRQRRVSVG